MKKVPGSRDGLEQTTLWFPEGNFTQVPEQETTQEKVRTKSLHVEDSLEAGVGRNEQPPGDISSDTPAVFTYTGYILEGDTYHRKTFTFTCHEVGVYPNENPHRVPAMLARAVR